MKVLAIAPHPDDETLGAGGTLLRHAHAGDELYWLIVTQPDPNEWAKDVVAQCLAQVERVGQAYGFKEVIELGLPAARLDQLPRRETVDAITQAVRAIRPERIYTAGETDAHTDHLVTFEALMIACKTSRIEFGSAAVYAYEVLSSTEAAIGWGRPPFVPNTYCDIGSFMARKLEIMGLYKNQLQPGPLPRSLESIKALARYRGTGVGLAYAEAFRLVRQVLA